MRSRFLFSAIVLTIFCSSVQAYDWSTNPGDGSEENPYQISMPEQLMSIGSDEILVTKHYILTNDIVFDPNNNPDHIFKGKALIAPDDNLNSVAYDGNPFTGTFDGQAYVIDGLTFDRCGFHGGLFGQIGQEGCVFNLTLQNVNIKSADYISSGDRSRYTGGVCGINYGILNQCHVSGNIIGGERSHYLGGICGENYNTISDCSTNIYISLGDYSNTAGGITAINRGIIKSCHVSTEISCGHRAGGAGGICGQNYYGSIFDSKSVIQIQGTNGLGGICGSNQSGHIRRCHSEGFIAGETGLGGICAANNSGFISETTSQCEMSGLSDSEYVGGFCGINDSGIISGCSSTGDVSILAESTKVGGFCGTNSSGCIINCYTACNLTGLEECRYIGGFCGSNNIPNPSVITNCAAICNIILGADSYGVGAFCGMNSEKINNCFSRGAVLADESRYCGGICGGNNGEIKNCYSTSIVQGENSLNLGGICGNNSGGNIEDCFWDIETSAIMISDGGEGLSTTQMQDINIYLSAGWDFTDEDENGTSQIWLIKPDDYPSIAILSGSYAEHTYEGEGTAENPYLIYDMYDLGAVYRDITASYRLMEDIDFSGVSWSSAVIPYYSNVFDGNGHFLLNVSVTCNRYAGFCGALQTDASIIDLKLENVSVIGSNGSNFLGTVCGYNQSSEVLNCRSSGIITTGDNSKFIGGICGSNESGIITDVVSNMMISCGVSSSYFGGLCGQTNKGSLYNCLVTGALNGNNGSELVGGLCGLSSYGIIEDCSTNMDIEVDDSSGQIGGFCGRVTSTTISRSCSMGHINTGLSSGYLGGFIGYGFSLDRKINQCFASGNVTGGDGALDVGGFIGFPGSYAKISNCYATGSVSGSKNIGGFFGYSVHCTISNCYSTGSVSGSENIGGLIGQDVSSTINASYWDIQTSNVSNSAGGDGKNTNEMMQQSTFSGWDFIGETTNGTEDIWFIREGVHYPKLWWEHHRPFANAGADQTVYAWIDGLAEVQLDGTGSFDPDGDALTYVWYNDANELIATGAEPNVLFGAGEYEVTLIVNDGMEDSEPNWCRVTVVEALEGEARILPKSLNRKRQGQNIIGWLLLPDGVDREDLDSDESLVLVVGDTEIEAKRQSIMGGQGRGRYQSSVSILAFFDTQEVLDAVDENGNVELILATRLSSGQTVYGTDEVRVFNLESKQKKVKKSKEKDKRSLSQAANRTKG